MSHEHKNTKLNQFNYISKRANFRVLQNCSVRRKFQNIDEIDFEDYSTKPHPNKRFNQQHLVKKSGLIFGFSPMESTASTTPKLLATTPSSPSLHLPIVSNSQLSSLLRRSCRSDLCQTWQSPHGQQEKQEIDG